MLSRVHSRPETRRAAFRAGRLTVRGRRVLRRFGLIVFPDFHNQCAGIHDVRIGQIRGFVRVAFNDRVNQDLVAAGDLADA